MTNKSPHHKKRNKRTLPSLFMIAAVLLSIAGLLYWQRSEVIASKKDIVCQHESDEYVRGYFVTGEADLSCLATMHEKDVMAERLGWAAGALVVTGVVFGYVGVRGVRKGRQK